ncbi:MAG: Gfo/Idh/MocA family oxidoreductase [Candidatus Bathyarchaeia archaeon]
MALGVGVVGCGGQGLAHIERFLRDGRVKLQAVCDVDEAKAKEVAKRFNVEYYTSYEEFLENPNLDIVSIATPNYMHASQTVAALNAGKHTLCEKPMALTVEDCDEMIKASEKSGRLLAVGFQLRFKDAFQKVRSLLHELEEPLNAYVLRLSPNPYDLNLEWRRKKSLMGGLILSMNCHEIDMMRWLLGEIDYVKADLKTMLYGDIIDYEDNAWLTLGFKRGLTAVLGSSMTAHTSVYEYMFICRGGTVILHPWENKISVFQEHANRTVIAENDDPLQKEISCFIDSVEDGKLKPPLASGIDGRAATAVIEAARRSSEKGGLAVKPRGGF